MRLVLHLLRQDTATVEAFGNSIITLKREVKYCRVCHNISDTETCQICANPQRDASTVCVVENIRDVMAVEATQQYRGLYHVLGGVISPMDGVGPSDLQIESLVQRVSEGGIKEVILALSTTMEGDTTNFYIYRKLEKDGSQTECNRTWHIRWRRTGICRRNHPGTQYCQPDSFYRNRIT